MKAKIELSNTMVCVCKKDIYMAKKQDEAKKEKE